MLFKNARIGQEITDIEVENGIIKRVGRTVAGGIDLKHQKVFAGLVDIHIHGCIGFDTMDGKYLDEMSVFLAKNGITSWLPTTMTMDMETIKSIVNPAIKRTKGAVVLGYHLEGPYINAKYKGAQNEAYIRPCDLDTFNELKNIKMVTLAPETEHALSLIENCDAIVSIGHTDCDYACAVDAIERGAKCLTHVFNAMPPLHHRAPGPIGAALDQNIYVQVICDGIHLHPSVVRMLYHLFGADRMVLISDGMRATGLKDGDYEFGGQTVTVRGAVAKTQSGMIAGSTTTLIDCVKKAIKCGIPETEAFKMASQTPCELLGINRGKIEPGYAADFIVVNDDYDILHTIIGGECV